MNHTEKRAPFPLAATTQGSGGSHMLNAFYVKDLDEDSGDDWSLIDDAIDEEAVKGQTLKKEDILAVIRFIYAPDLVEDTRVIPRNPQGQRILDTVLDHMEAERISGGHDCSTRSPWKKPEGGRLLSFWHEYLLSDRAMFPIKQYVEDALERPKLAWVIAYRPLPNGPEKVSAQFLCGGFHDGTTEKRSILSRIQTFRNMFRDLNVVSNVLPESARIAELEAELMKAQARIAELEGAQSSPDVTGELWKIARDVPLIPSAFEFLKDGHTKEELARAIRDHVTGTPQEFPRYVTSLLEVNLPNKKLKTVNALRNAATRTFKEPEQAGKAAKKQGKSKRQK